MSKSKRMKPSIQDPMLAAMAEVESLLNYRFQDPSLLEEALTHSSDPDHVSYQRLEFVGDAALGLAFTNYFYLTKPDVGPGDLSILRAANISTEKLARVAVKHGLYHLLRRNSPKLDEMVEEFTLVVEKENKENLYGHPYGGNTIKAPKVLADIVESIAAAVYVDCNFNLEALWMVFRGLLEPIITAENLNEQPVTSLYEYCQKKGKALDIKNWKKKGNVNVTNVFVDGELLGIGSSEHQIIAKLNAARDALQKFADMEEDDDNKMTQMGNGGEENNNAKHRLNEMCGKKHWPKPIYRVDSEYGPAHDKKYASSVLVVTPNREYYQVGDHKSRVKDTENSAAAKVLHEINKMSSRVSAAPFSKSVRKSGTFSVVPSLPRAKAPASAQQVHAASTEGSKPSSI